jgi:hypothetical protein
MSEVEEGQNKEEKFQSILDDMPTHIYLGYGKTVPPNVDTSVRMPERVVAIFNFSVKGFGFGEITIITDEDGKTFIDTENMGADTAIHFLKQLVENSILDTEQDPEKHAKYIEARVQTCGDHCIPCKINKAKGTT